MTCSRKAGAQDLDLDLDLDPSNKHEDLDCPSGRAGGVAGHHVNRARKQQGAWGLTLT